VRPLLFGPVHRGLCALGVWLYNGRDERSLANTMFRWLHAEATLAGDSEVNTPLLSIAA
jgi:hypothetical protein